MVNLIIIGIIFIYVIPLISAICLSGIIIQKHIESDRAIVMPEFIKGIIMTIFPILNLIQAIKLYHIVAKLFKKIKTNERKWNR